MIDDPCISDAYAVDPTLLRTFVTVVHHGSFSAAARELAYTQSAVSQQIAVLESELGAPLLHRRPVAVTEAGARLLEHAGPILLRLEAARADVARAARPPTDRLVLGCSPGAMTRTIADALAALREHVAGIALTVVVEGRAAVTAAVTGGQVDAALVDGIAASNDPLRLPDAGALTRIGIVETALCVVLPAGHPLARRPGLRLPDLVDARWLDAPDAAAPLASLQAAVGGDGPRAGLRYTGSDTAAVQALVAAGHGLAVLPYQDPFRADVTVVPLVAPPLVHRTELVHGHLVPGPVRRLVAVLQGGVPPG